MPRWVLQGDDWRAGDHAGTLAGTGGLELVSGVSRGVLRRQLEPRGPLLRLVASLDPAPWPAGAGARLAVRARLAERWSAWRSLGVFGADHGLPRSEAAPADADGLRVAIDVLEAAAPLEELELRLELEAGSLGGSPRLRRLTLLGWDPSEPPPAHPGDRRAWGRTLDLPQRSQRELEGDLPTRGCSPTALAMALAALGYPLEPSVVARGVYDAGAGIYGNWAFNVAFAAALGVDAAVERWDLGALEAEVAAGRPAVISERHEVGELDGSPLPRTDGHLLAVAGFTATGDVLVHDPAAEPRRGEPVRRVYCREQLARAWVERAGGVAYALRPRGSSSG